MVFQKNGRKDGTKIVKIGQKMEKYLKIWAKMHRT